MSAFAWLNLLKQEKGIPMMRNRFHPSDKSARAMFYRAHDQIAVSVASTPHGGDG